MKLMLCISEENGLLFNRRRQSSDAVLREKMLSLTDGRPLLVNAYTASQFQSTESLTVREDFLTAANEGDFCFAETDEPPLEQAEELYLFRWNRRYPADRFLDIATVERDFKTVSTEEFTGSSHPKITLTVYRRK